ncbi:MAG: hypothetical protein H6624_14390 [Bdellovibrionaceae bacterium]|nr:hypothetical protein [Bdellovibrionales bacterium]MCB9085532.1 hypothetical protein [Pseudobdellovibrionaceae bacterium]
MSRNLLILIVVSVFVSACGSSGRSRPRGKHCPNSYEPIALELSTEGNQKISLDPKDNQLIQGLYEYAGAEFYYWDTQEDIKIHVKEDVGPKGEPFASNVCVRGVAPKMELLTAVYGMDSMQVDAGGKTSFSMRKYQIHFKDNFLSKEFAEPEGEIKPASPHKLYQSKASDFSFYRLSDPNRFEVRSVQNLGNVRQYLLIRYQLKSNP